MIANLTPWNLKELLGEALPPGLKRLEPRPRTGWGAFVVYAGLDGGVVPEDFQLHHQFVAGRPLGKGNSVFLSFSSEPPSPSNALPALAGVGWEGSPKPAC